MYVITEKKLQLNSASLRSRNFYHWGYFNLGGPGPLGRPLATPMNCSTYRQCMVIQTQYAWTHYFEVDVHLTSQWGIYYALTQHLVTSVTRDGWEIAVCLRRFLLVNGFKRARMAFMSSLTCFVLWALIAQLWFLLFLFIDRRPSGDDALLQLLLTCLLNADVVAIPCIFGLPISNTTVFSIIFTCQVNGEFQPSNSSFGQGK